MRTLLNSVAALAVTTLVLGCSGNPSVKSDPVDISGTVTGVSGQPVSGVTLNFFPTSSSQSQVGIGLKGDGKFAVKLIPGTYTIAFEGNAGPMAAIPVKFHSNDAANVVDVAPGAPVSIKLAK